MSLKGTYFATEVCSESPATLDGATSVQGGCGCRGWAYKGKTCTDLSRTLLKLDAEVSSWPMSSQVSEVCYSKPMAGFSLTPGEELPL